MFDFVHIGYGKCMSTYLQTTWSKSGNCDFVSGVSLSTKIDGIVEPKREHPETLPDLKLALEPVPARRAGRHSVLSSEGFTFSWLTRPEMGNYVLLKQKYVASQLAGLTRKVLILVRSPVSWIKSAHAQMIKQGGHAPMSGFVRDYRAVVLNNLNLKMLVSFWQAYDVQTVILPIELFKDNEARFWSLYCEQLGVSRPDFKGAIGALGSNTSDYTTLTTHATLNSLFDVLKTQVRGRNAPDRDQCMQALDIGQKWGTRRALTDIDEAGLAKIRGMLAVPEQAAFLQLCVDAKFRDYLLEYFVAPLVGLPQFDAYCGRYRDELLAVTEG